MRERFCKRNRLLLQRLSKVSHLLLLLANDKPWLIRQKSKLKYGLILLVFAGSTYSQSLLIYRGTTTNECQSSSPSSNGDHAQTYLSATVGITPIVNFQEGFNYLCSGFCCLGIIMSATSNNCLSTTYCTPSSISGCDNIVPIASNDPCNSTTKAAIALFHAGHCIDNTTISMQKFLFRFKTILVLSTLLSFCPLLTTAQIDISVGTGSAGNSGNDYPCPLQDYFEGSRAQYLFLASELNAGGMGAGFISALKFNVTSLNGFSGNIEQMSVKVGTTSTNSLSTSET
ncbi:hypothetical protein HMI54_013341, partial [Coelomomyces lativittatus]